MASNVKGFRELEQELKKMTPRAVKALGAGVYALGNKIITNSKRRVPVDLGVLRGSGYATLPETKRLTAIVELGYGGPAKDYAIVQHENLHFQHPEGGEAKYLENAVNEETSSAVRVVSEHAARAFLNNKGAIRNNAVPVDPDEGREEE